MLERLSEDIRGRTYVVRIFPNSDACPRLVRALAVETHENWLEAHRYLNMHDPREHKKAHLAKPPKQPIHDRPLQNLTHRTNQVWIRARVSRAMAEER